MTFNNERQKADVSVVKQDKDTRNHWMAVIFALYASDDIKNADGTVVVKKEHWLRKQLLEQMELQNSQQIFRWIILYSVKEDQERRKRL